MTHYLAMLSPRGEGRNGDYLVFVIDAANSHPNSILPVLPFERSFLAILTIFMALAPAYIHG